MVTKTCARSICGRAFAEEEESPFITCPACRKPLPVGPGGCTRYSGVSNRKTYITTTDDGKLIGIRRNFAHWKEYAPP